MPAAAQVEQPEEERLKEALKTVIDRLDREAGSRVDKRTNVEKRWLEDLRQFHSEYEPKILKELKDAGKSTLFINQTRPKTNACEARLSDMLFPTDDKNWGISPTPVPELDKAAKAAVDQAKALVGQANAMKDAGQEDHVLVAQQADQTASTANKLKSEMDEARTRAAAMSDEIEDQLTECGYNSHARDVISDACKLGTGIMKGPIAHNERSRRSWTKVEREGSGTIYELGFVEDPRPAYYRVDPWSFFPEPDARTPQESGSNFERHLWSDKDLRKLARKPGFDRDAIRRLLKQGPSRDQPAYLNQVREITGENLATDGKKFIGWEYRGPLTADEMRDICACLGRDDIAGDYDDRDPLDEINVAIWFCQGEIIKFGVHHLDSGESIYSVYNLDKDESSIWGYGIPALMRDSQAALNGAWRMMMDNAGLASGPQIVVDSTVVEPENGIWELVARKIWKRRANAAGKDAFNVYNIDSHQAELANIIALAKQFIDDETSITVLAQGEQGAHTTQTAQGMALLMNAVNVVFRRMVKNFDDDMTVPNIRRLYDWNMQFSAKEHIRGDFEVDARGTSVLLVRELQAQNLLLLSNLTSHPVIGVVLKSAEIVRKLVQSMMIKADEVVKTDEEIKQALDAAQGEQGDQDPQGAIKLQIATLEANSRLQVAQMHRETELIKLAQQHNMTLDKLRAMLEVKRMDTESKERILATEAAVEARRPQEAGAGSGGYI